MAAESGGLRAAVERFLEPGERVVDMLPADKGSCRMQATPAPPKDLELSVFGGVLWHERSLASRTVSVILDVICSTQPTRGHFGDPAARQKCLQKKHAFWGAWDSLAGGLLRGLQPVGAAHKILLLTDRRIQLVYVQGDGKDGSFAVEPGWRADPRTIVWVRDCKDYMPGHYQLGFSDGSWMPVFFPKQVRGRFAALYPHAQHWKQPLPDVLAGPAAQGRP
ncbi:hypothetical protein AB0I10_05105 [Streptomyces sp. NPDC050636]|uniref:hypothetical protein n=1 Tax=Streptomyces sp. NPDC050636 TaxID=3154510 RepID=UPI00342E6568